MSINQRAPVPADVGHGDKGGVIAAQTTESVEIPSDEVLAAPAARVIARLSSPSFSAPLLPAVALEVHTLAYKGNADVVRIIAALEKDPLLAGRVLKVAQSAAYHALSGITSLRDAVVRVGLHPLVDILWEVAFTTRVLRAPRYEASIEAVLEHSMACGHLMRMVCKVARVPREYAFLCGLLHDAGTTACLSVMADPRSGEESPPDAWVGPILRLCHEQATRILAQLWKLPPEVQDVIAHHHGRDGGELSPLRAALIITEAVAAALDPRISLVELGADVTDPAVVARAREVLGLTDEQMSALYAEGAAVLEALSGERRGQTSRKGEPHPETSPVRASAARPVVTARASTVLSAREPPRRRKVARAIGEWFAAIWRSLTG